VQSAQSLPCWPSHITTFLSLRYVVAVALAAALSAVTLVRVAGGVPLAVTPPRAGSRPGSGRSPAAGGPQGPVATPPQPREPHDRSPHLGMCGLPRLLFVASTVCCPRSVGELMRPWARLIPCRTDDVPQTYRASWHHFAVPIVGTSCGRGRVHMPSPLRGRFFVALFPERHVHNCCVHKVHGERTRPLVSSFPLCRRWCQRWCTPDHSRGPVPPSAPCRRGGAGQAWRWLDASRRW
jgi:hypothetical protein